MENSSRRSCSIVAASSPLFGSNCGGTHTLSTIAPAVSGVCSPVPVASEVASGAVVAVGPLEGTAEEQALTANAVSKNSLLTSGI